MDQINFSDHLNQSNIIYNINFYPIQLKHFVVDSECSRTYIWTKKFIQNILLDILRFGYSFNNIIVILRSKGICKWYEKHCWELWYDLNRFHAINHIHKLTGMHSHNLHNYANKCQIKIVQFGTRRCTKLFEKLQWYPKK